MKSVRKNKKTIAQFVRLNSKYSYQFGEREFFETYVVYFWLRK